MEVTPLSHWIGFHVLVVALLAVELMYSRWRGLARLNSTSLAATILWVAAAIGFAAFLFHSLGNASGVQYLASYALEESLSIDNLFVFLLLFRTFQIEPTRQPKVLFWGVLGAIVLRGAFILAGVGATGALPLDQLFLRSNPLGRRYPACFGLKTYTTTKRRAGSDGFRSCIP